MKNCPGTYSRNWLPAKEEKKKGASLYAEDRVHFIKIEDEQMANTLPSYSSSRIYSRLIVLVKVYIQFNCNFFLSNYDALLYSLTLRIIRPYHSKSRLVIYRDLNLDWMTCDDDDKKAQNYIFISTQHSYSNYYNKVPRRAPYSTNRKIE